MDFDFNPFFEKYEKLVSTADGIFDQIKKSHPECVQCRIECADCCYALFDLSLIEALYLNNRFLKTFAGEQKERLLDKANRTDRATYKLKRDAYRSYQKGKSEQDIMEQMAEKRIRCPLLNERNLCDLYAFRPITCRLYGIPTSIGGQAYTCGKSGFKKGLQYPTVNIDVIHKQLYEISGDLVRALKSNHVRMAEILVPVSMAILTEYDDTYLGIRDSGGGKAISGEK